MEFNRDWVFHEASENVRQTVTLPHDAMIDGSRSADSKGGAANAYFNGGIYVYEKSFDVPSEWKDKFVAFEFEGVYRNAKVYINDNLAGENAYGYTGFYVYADSFLKYGESNTIKVVADNSQQPNSRWYTGGGIYRPVHIIVKNKTHFKLDGVKVKTISYEPAKISISAEHAGGSVKFEVFDGNKKIAEAQGDSCEIAIENAKLWSENSPYLYTLKTSLYENGELSDEEEVPFGIRLIEWNTKGLFVNGKNTLLRGGCVHHDNGILGARCYAEAEERKVRIIKEAGFNAIRSSHNPCSKAFVSACDKYGIYLIDETWDMWYMRKKKFDYALDFDKWHKSDIEAIVAKDYNHPSVIMYSIGNELSEPCEDKGNETAKQLADYFCKLDDGRPVTAGINLFIIHGAASGKGQYSAEKVEADALPKKQEKAMSSTVFNMIAMHAGPSMNKMANSDDVDKVTTPVFAALDIAGYNYASGRYPLEGDKHPERVLYGSETFPQDIYKNWEVVKKYPYILGDFMWTAWDYLGEVGIGGWHYETQYGMTFEKPYPWIIADTGAIDIIGTVGAEAKYASTVWGFEDKPYIAVSPVNQQKTKLIKSVWRGTNAISSWSWKDCEKKRAEIEVYSSASYIVLYLNGEELGKKKVKECKAIFKTCYKPGVLEAVALDKAGQEVARTYLKSADGTEIRLVCESETVQKGGLAFVDVTLADENGVVESNADCTLKATVEGGQLLAFGSAQQKTEEKYSSDTTQTYYGRALLVLRADENTVTVKVSSENSPCKTLVIKTV